MAIITLSTASEIAEKSISLNRTATIAQTMATTTKMILTQSIDTKFASEDVYAFPNKLSYNNKEKK
jgi:hypothetical protein